MKLGFQLIFFTVCFQINIFSQSGTFDFEPATTTTFDEPLKVTQTVGARTLTVTTTPLPNDDLDYSFDEGYYGLHGFAVYAVWQDYATTLVLTFNASVNIVSLRAFEVGNHTYTWTFTPNSGPPIDRVVDGINGSTINFGTNFLGITSLTITKQGGGSINPGIDDVVIDGALPVELTSFTAAARNSIVTLNWETATEVNNYGFDVERKTTGAWSTVGFVEGHGSTNVPQSYRFIDGSASGKASYRLKQTDRDGSFTYSEEVEVIAKTARNAFELSQNYPNPFNPTTNISFTVPANGHATLKIFNALGQEVATLFDGEAQAGVYNDARFDASRLASGMYVSRLEYNGSVQMKKLTLMK